MSIKIAHLSDPHFGTTTPEVMQSLRTRLQTLAPQLILVTGDVTQRARAKQFRQAKLFLDLFAPTPILVVPGNHDIPLWNLLGRLAWPYAGFRHILKTELSGYFDLQEFEVLILNSTHRLHHIQGLISLPELENQVQRLTRLNSIKIVAFHHPVDCRQIKDEKNLLINRAEVLQFLATKNIDMILGGHIHDPFVALSEKRYPQLERSMICVVAGTCLSWRTRSGAPNSFNLIESHSPSEASITRFDLNEAMQFLPCSQSLFSRSAEGWRRLAPPVQKAPGTF